MEREYPSLSGNADKHRDVFMEDIAYRILYSLELETESDYSMPERVMVYNACEYEQQIGKLIKKHEDENMKDGYREWKSRLKEEDALMPVVTVVLYLGTDHWEGRIRLSELFRVPGSIQMRMDIRIPEYGFHLAEADYVDAENFESDLREFFQAMKYRKDKKKLKELFHSERFCNLSSEAAQAIAVHIDRKRLLPKVKKEGVVMCQAFDELMEDMRMEGVREGKKAGIKVGIKKGIREGKKEGIKEGERKERISIVHQMLAEGMDEALIRKLSQCSTEELAVADGR